MVHGRLPTVRLERTAENNGAVGPRNDVRAFRGSFAVSRGEVSDALLNVGCVHDNRLSSDWEYLVVFNAEQRFRAQSRAVNDDAIISTDRCHGLNAPDISGQEGDAALSELLLQPTEVLGRLRRHSCKCVSDRRTLREILLRQDSELGEKRRQRRLGLQFMTE